MHGIVSNLEKRGLVERKSDTSHGRILCTELTDQGHKVVAQAHDIFHAILFMSSDAILNVSLDIN